MKRGEIWTVAGGPDYVGKPRPAIVVQSDKFDATPSITICPLTATPLDAFPMRFAIAPSKRTGLQLESYAMVDKLSTIPKSKAGLCVGVLDSSDIAKLNTAIALFLGFADVKPD